MPYLETAQLWLSQSTLLIQARPHTARITSKYNISPPADPSNPKSIPRKSNPKSDEQSPANPTLSASVNDPVRATFTLTTYDSASGVTLKYETTKAAEVSRLIQILGRLARPMTGLPEAKEEMAPEAAGGEIGSGVATPLPDPVPVGGKAGGQGGAGGKKGKKKGKK